MRERSNRLRAEKSAGGESLAGRGEARETDLFAFLSRAICGKGPVFPGLILLGGVGSDLGLLLSFGGGGSIFSCVGR